MDHADMLTLYFEGDAKIYDVRDGGAVRFDRAQALTVEQKAEARENIEASKTGHNHDGRYYTETEADARFAAIAHNHDGRYYTETEADARFAAIAHNHDGRYYTETEADARFAAKEHGHGMDDLDGTLPVSKGGTGASDAATARENLGIIAAVLPVIYPVGCIYMSTSGENPAVTFGFGTWTAWGAGRVPVGVGSGTDANGVSKSFAAGDTGGEYDHTLTVDELAEHSHGIGDCSEEAPGYGLTISGAFGDRVIVGGHEKHKAGGDQAHNNIQPYITCYMWKRTA